MHSTLLNHYIYGSFYPIGGASEIAFHIIPVIQRAGGKVLVRAPVTQILLDDSGRAYGEFRFVIDDSTEGSLTQFWELFYHDSLRSKRVQMLIAS